MFGKNSRQQQPAASATLSKVQLLPLPLPRTPCSLAPLLLQSGFLFFAWFVATPKTEHWAAFAVGKFRCCSVSFYPDLSWKWNCCCAVVFPLLSLSVYQPTRNMCQWFLMPFKNITAEVSAQFVCSLCFLYGMLFYFIPSVEREKQKERERESRISPWLKSDRGQPFFKWPANERVSAFAKV